MSKNYSWRIAEQSDFYAVYSFLFNSKLRKNWDVDDVRRRVIIPLFLEQLIIFEDDQEKLCGFLTCAFMNSDSASHQNTIGVLPNDWRSGPDFWVVDFVAPNGSGQQMLRTVVRDLSGTVISKINYFRLKYQEVRSVTI